VFTRPWSGGYWTTLLPADLDGLREPEAGSPQPIATLAWEYNTGVQAWGMYLNVLKLRVSLSNPSQSGLYGPVRLESARFNPLERGAPQRGSSTALYAYPNQLMNRFAYRRFATYEAAVVSHAVDAGNSSVQRGAVQWYEVSISRWKDGPVTRLRTELVSFFILVGEAADSQRQQPVHPPAGGVWARARDQPVHEHDGHGQERGHRAGVLHLGPKPLPGPGRYGQGGQWHAWHYDAGAPAPFLFAAAAGVSPTGLPAAHGP
jgi:hypothetical protein